MSNSVLNFLYQCQAEETIFTEFLGLPGKEKVKSWITTNLRAALNILWTKIKIGTKILFLYWKLSSTGDDSSSILVPAFLHTFNPEWVILVFSQKRLPNPDLAEFLKYFIC
ncbi:hypothetical protein Y1Q_0003197 [Alligator mississippiensis]|uniref:Uncharacterized protein n=1 Tax=Alligator mississippiensis TaxID=8496 RepID=A0A151MDX3_ALLMI|nr:hypothetical protein Y1Q_0003197 [Alligator mississippiensis]